MKLFSYFFSVPRCFLLACCLMVTTVLAMEQGKSAQTEQPLIREISPGLFQVGTVQLNKSERSIHFPATINMTNGPIEYLLVTSVGKLHESVFRTAINPLDIHVAALLLGAKGAGTNLTVHQFNTRNIPGEKTSLFFRRELAGNAKTIAAEDCVLNAKTGKAMSRGVWVYNGSQVHGGGLVAQRDGLVISIMSDPLALLNNPRPGRENDEIWQVNSNSIPPLNSSVEFTIQFQKVTE